jgi:hypothetical protein
VPAERLFIGGWTAVAARPAWFGIAGAVMRAVQRLIGRRPRWLPYPLSAWMTARDLPAAPRRAFRDRRS